MFFHSPDIGGIVYEETLGEIEAFILTDPFVVASMGSMVWFPRIRKVPVEEMLLLDRALLFKGALLLKDVLPFRGAL